MATIKITAADLIGSIENFPIEIVEKMVEEQVRQGNKADVRVFQKYCNSDREMYGFTWYITEDGNSFWHKVINERNFEWFFKKYPKVDSKVYIIGNSKIGIDIIKTLEKRGGVNKYDLKGTDDDVIYYIDPMSNIINVTAIGDDVYNVVSATFNRIEAERQKIVISISDIAKQLGVLVSQIVIKA